MVKKYGLIGTILSISILLTLVILGPNAVAATNVDGGDLLSQVSGTPPTPFADADVNTGGIPFSLGGNPVIVKVDWIIDNQADGASDHGFYLRITNLDYNPEVQTDEDELYIGVTGGPSYQSGQLEAQVDGRLWDQIEIYIYVNVTYGVNFDEDDDTAIRTLIP